MVWYLATKGEHTVLYKLYKNIYTLKPQIV